MYFGARVRLAALPQPVKAGYVFRGWHTDAACENAFAGGTMPVGGLTLYAKWEAGQNTAYKVEHYLQNADGSYPDAASQTENLAGATGCGVEAVVQTTTGYHEDTENGSAVKSGTIAADGSLVLRVYYVRDTYILTFKNAGEADFVSTRRWGERVSEPALTVTKPGYALSWSPRCPRRCRRATAPTRRSGRRRATLPTGSSTTSRTRTTTATRSATPTRSPARPTRR